MAACWGGGARWRVAVKESAAQRKETGAQRKKEAQSDARFSRFVGSRRACASFVLFGRTKGSPVSLLFHLSSSLSLSPPFSSGLVAIPSYLCERRRRSAPAFFSPIAHKESERGARGKVGKNASSHRARARTFKRHSPCVRQRVRRAKKKRCRRATVARGPNEPGWLSSTVLVA